VEIKTIDGFQGSEKDLIIFSTVRSFFIAPKERNPKRGIGFLNDKRRMNVSLSRCRLCLIIVGDIYKLRVDNSWRGLIEYAFKSGSVYKVKEDNIEDWFS
jgi:senataxin